MKRNILLFILLGVTHWMSAYTVTQWPFVCDFENPAVNAEWQFTHHNSHYEEVTPHNIWTIGTLPNDPTNHVLFLTYDGTHTQYIVSENDGEMSGTRANIPLDGVSPGFYHVSFDYMVGGREDKHFLSHDFVCGGAYAWDYYDRWNWNFQLGDRRYLIGVPSWAHYEYDVEVKENSTRGLSFNWHMEGNDTIPTRLSAVIDNIEVRPIGTFDCVEQPLYVAQHREGNDAVFTWSANASEYEVEYHRLDSTHIAYTQTNITSTEYRVDCSTISEGTYAFRVRSICGNDTSAWSLLSPVLMYDQSKHCMDFLDLDNEDVSPRHGYFWCPSCEGGKYDMGYYSKQSRHTVHYMLNDYDERTGYRLRTYPLGHPASVRLGNWEADARAEEITYTMTITEDMKVMKLWYALVMQLPGHMASEQPRFTLEILDSLGNYFDEHCGVVDFTAAANMEGWQLEPSHRMNDTTSVIWKDWSMIGINLRDYVGQTIQIRLTTKDCANTEHFGYAYFAMECSRGDMEGVHCGMKPDHFTVEEGFKYRWYRKYEEPRHILGTERTYQLTNSIDTATYCVDIMQLLDTTCYFTLEASSLAYIPNAKATSKWVPDNCQNYIQMVDSSSTQGVYWTPTGQKIVVTQMDGAETYLWDFGVYGSSTERNPKLAIPDEGDTVHIVLHAMMENGMCDDVLSWDMVVPAVGLRQQTETHYICEGDSITVHGVTYTKDGYYTIDSLRSWTGCDSVYTISIQYFTQDTIHYYDSICISEVPFLWRGLSITESGDYIVRIPGSGYECDSVKDMLHLYVRPELTARVEGAEQNICMDMATIHLDLKFTSSTADRYSIYYDSIAHLCGMRDIVEQWVDNNRLQISLPNNLRPGEIGGQLVLYNFDCDELFVPIHWYIRYAADSVITQRWNDFLSVRKSAYDYYGGFVDYQWYEDDVLMPGETQSQLYLPETGLKDADYSVEMTRVSDGVRIRSCAYHPVLEPNTLTLNVYPTILSSKIPMPVTVESTKSGVARLFESTGSLREQLTINEGINLINIPSVSGLYLLQVETVDGHIQTRKIIVE